MILEFPNIDPVAFWLGPLPIRWYALAYLTGFLLGWHYCKALVDHRADDRPHKDDIEDFLPWAIVGVIFGGRIGYILFYHMDIFIDHPLAIFKVWQGGMSFHGGLLGVMVALIAYPMMRQFSILRLADVVCAAAPIGLFFGRIANFINGELYGRITDMPWGVIFPGGGDLPRHPSQLYEAALEGAALFALLFFMARSQRIRRRPGAIAGAFLLGYGTFRSLIELFRAPDDHLGFIIAELSMGQLLSLPMIAAGIGLIIFAQRRGYV